MICAYQDIYIVAMAAQPPIQVLIQIIFTSGYSSRVPLNFRETSLSETMGAKNNQNKSKTRQKIGQAWMTIINAWSIFLGVFQFILNFFYTHGFRSN